MTSSWSKPFGFRLLNSLHDALLEGEDFNLTACALWILVMAPLLPQAYLLLAPGTRPARAALGVFGLGLILNVWSRYRFTDNTYNLFSASAVLVIVSRYIEWGLLVGPIVDPWMACGGRHRLLAALDLTLNVRGIYLGSVGLDTTSGPPNATVSLCSKRCPGDGSCQKTPAQTTPPPGPQFPHVTGRPKTRLGSIRRHLFNIVWRSVVMDILYTHIRVVGRDTLYRPGGMKDALGAFTSRVGVRVLPHIFPDVEVPATVLAIAAELFIPTAVMLWIGMIYHAVSVVAIASALWPVAAWDTDIFDSPFLATSIIDLWGRRWHQVMRHPLVIMGASVTHLFSLPNTSITLIPLTFLSSAVFHTLTHLTMDPVPDSGKIMSFFLLSGLGCGAEVVFKRITGRRVGGRCGRIWTTAFMLATGRLAAEAWLDAGFIPSLKLPPGGIGDMISRWLWSWAYTPFQRNI